MFGLLKLLLGTLLVLAVLAGVAFLVPGPVDRKTLANSVGLSRVLSSASCHAGKSKDFWDCSAADPTSSGSSSYAVVLKGNCWKGTRETAKAGEAGMPKDIQGCVTLVNWLQTVVPSIGF